MYSHCTVHWCLRPACQPIHAQKEGLASLAQNFVQGLLGIGRMHQSNCTTSVNCVHDKHEQTHFSIGMYLLLNDGHDRGAVLSYSNTLQLLYHVIIECITM